MATTVLPRLSRPSLSHFASLLERSQPSVLLNLLDQWPALRSWQRVNDYGSLRTLGKGRLVDVEWSRRGRGFLDPGERGKSRLPLDLYLDAFLLGRIPSTGNSPANDTIFYVAQQDLLSDIPGISEDIPERPFEPDYLTQGKGEFWRANMWIGPEGTYTPIHRDPYHNLFCQIAASKTFFLYPPTVAAKGLYLAPAPQHQTSLVPVAPHLADLKAFPDFEAVREHEVRVVLRPGETLFLPKGWWHAVLAEDLEAKAAEGVSLRSDCEGRISVNYWWL